MPNCRPAKPGSFLAEVIGPAGAGKTTLMRELSRRDPCIEAVLSLRRWRYVPAFVRRTLGELPAALRRLLSGERLTWKEFRMLVHLRAVHDTVSRGTWGGRPVVLFDQGPVYMLAGLLQFAAQRPVDHAFEKWWNERLNEWFATLDVIVFLDAPRAVLLERIRGRKKRHQLRTAGDAEAFARLDQAVSLFDEVVERLSEIGGIRVLRFDTQHESPEQTVDHVLDCIKPQLYADRFPEGLFRNDKACAAAQVQD